MKIWERAKELSRVFRNFRYNENLFLEIEKITGKRAIKASNNEKSVALWLAIALLNKRMSDIESKLNIQPKKTVPEKLIEIEKPIKVSEKPIVIDKEKALRQLLPVSKHILEQIQAGDVSKSSLLQKYKTFTKKDVDSKYLAGAMGMLLKGLRKKGLISNEIEFEK